MNNDRMEGNKNFSVTDPAPSSSSSSSSSRLDNNNNNNNDKDSQSANLLTDFPTSQKEVRIPVSFKCKPVIHRNFKKFCANLERQEQECYEIAMQDFMLKYQHLIGDRPVFNLVGQKDLDEIKETCTIVGCGAPRVAKAVYLPRQQEYLLCSAHLLEYRNRHKIWKIVQTFD